MVNIWLFCIPKKLVQRRLVENVEGFLFIARLKENIIKNTLSFLSVKA